MLSWPSSILTPSSRRTPVHALLLALILLIVTAFYLSNNARQSMRLCVPVSLQRISSAAHKGLACGYTTSAIQKQIIQGGGMSNHPTSGKLADFLRSQKQEFLDDLDRGNGKSWVLAMGNEAGGEYEILHPHLSVDIYHTPPDLDTIASSISFAVLSSTLTATRSIPLILTPRDHMSLRPENLLALDRAGIPLDSLLYLQDFKTPSNRLASLGVRFALLDHNALLPEFRENEEGHSESGGQTGKKVSGESTMDPVVAIIDHHADEGAHLGAETRWIQVPTGSTTSLLTMHFRQAWEASLNHPAGVKGSPVPSMEVSTLLLQAILVDTGALKVKDNGEATKTTETDVEAADFLFPLSSFGQGVTLLRPDGKIPQVLQDPFDELIYAKTHIEHLATPLLLARDYKEYEFETKTPGQHLRVGLVTVPLGMKAWLTREDANPGWKGFMGDMIKRMDERDLDISGVLTTYRSAKGKGRREVVIVVRPRVGMGIDAAMVFGAIESAFKASTHPGLVPDFDLQAEDWSKAGMGDEGSGIELLKGGEGGGRRMGGIWVQANTGATRKQIAPLMVSATGKVTRLLVFVTDVLANYRIQKWTIARL